MAVRLLSRLLARLSTPALLRLGAMMGWVWYRLVPLRKADARIAIARAFPEKSAAEVEQILRANLRHMCTSLLETLAMLSMPEERVRRIVRFEGLDEAVTAARAAGRGVVVTSGHVGSFELSMSAYAMFTRIPVVIIARLPSAGFARTILEMVRARTGIESVPPRGALPKIVSRLTERNMIFGYVGDQNESRKRGVFVEFLGAWCCAAPGASLIARRAGSVIVPGSNRREPGGTHLGTFGPAMALDPHPHLRTAILNDTWELNRRCEEWIRRAPEQWFWVHRRWKTQPLPGDVVRTRAGLEIAGEGGASAGRTAAFLDRDGVVNMELGRAVHTPEELRLVPGAAEGIRRLRAAGIPVVLVTNQAAVARGTIDEAMLERIHARLRDLLAGEGAQIDAIYACLHHPSEGVGEYRIDCECRKPKPGLILRAAREMNLHVASSLVVGDRATDVACARAAGARGVLVENGWANGPWEKAEADEVHPDLVAAVDAHLDRLLGNAASAAPGSSMAAGAAAEQEENAA